MAAPNGKATLPRDQNQIQQDLIEAYDRAVDQRDKADVSDWKKMEREKFLRLLRDEDKTSLVDIGSGPGVHAMYFHEQGIEVTCLDLSPDMVARCDEKGLQAYLCDVMDLPSLGMTFDSAFAMNSLLHLPRAQIPGALMAIQEILTPRGLFYWGQYGGQQHEGAIEDDQYQPKRFYSLLEDKQIKAEASRIFKLEVFNPIRFEDDRAFHFQSLISRVRE